MNISAECSIPADHPSLAGHFPNEPIVPGVVILDTVLEVLESQHKDCRLATIPTVKFLVPLRPDQAFFVHLTSTKNCHIKFECRVEEHLIAQGLLEISNSAG